MTAVTSQIVSKSTISARIAAGAAAHCDHKSAYTRLQRIGKGAYGEVYKCFNNLTKQIVAIKVLDVDTDEQEIADIQKEVALLSQLTDVPGVTKYHDSFLYGTQLWIVMDFAAGGSVRELMKAGRFEERYIAAVTRSVTLALAHLHKWGIIHRDIKAANILLTQEGSVQLCDFGVAGQVTMYSLKRNSFVGSPYWMPPEVIKEMYYNFKADIWSLGITVFEMAMGNPPFADQDPMRAIFLIPRTLPARLPDDGRFSAQLREFVACCLRNDPEERPTAEALLKSRLMKSTAKTNPRMLRDLIVRYELWQSSNPAVKARSRKSEADQLNASENPPEDEEGGWQFETVKGVNVNGEEANHDGLSPPAVPRRAESRIVPPLPSQGVSCSTPAQRSFCVAHPLVRLFAEEKPEMHSGILLADAERYLPQIPHGNQTQRGGLNILVTAGSPAWQNQAPSPQAPADRIARPIALATPVCDSPVEVDAMQEAIVNGLDIRAGTRGPTVHEHPLFDFEDIERQALAHNSKATPSPNLLQGTRSEQKGFDGASAEHEWLISESLPMADSQKVHVNRTWKADGSLLPDFSAAQQADGEQHLQLAHVPEALDEMDALPSSPSRSSSLPTASFRSTPSLKRTAAVSRRKSSGNNSGHQSADAGVPRGVGSSYQDHGPPLSPLTNIPICRTYSGLSAGVSETERVAVSHLPRPSRNDSLASPEVTENVRRITAQHTEHLHGCIIDEHSISGAVCRHCATEGCCSNTGRPRPERLRDHQNGGRHSGDLRRSRSANSLRDAPAAWTAAAKDVKDHYRPAARCANGTRRIPEAMNNIGQKARPALNAHLRAARRRRSQSLTNLKPLKIFSGPDCPATILLPPSPSPLTPGLSRRFPSPLFPGPQSTLAPYSASQLSLSSANANISLEVLLLKPKPSLGPLLLEHMERPDAGAPAKCVPALLDAVDAWLEILEGGFSLCAYR